MREFFNDFYYEELTANNNNKLLIGEFTSKKENNSLEDYIKDEDKAWSDDLDGETKVYLIKDKSGDIALFFSVKCGLLVADDTEDILSEDEEDFVQNVMQVKASKDEEQIANMYDAGSSLFGERVDQLFIVADERMDAKNEAIEIGQSENTINVPNCISAIELKHFCKNEAYIMPENIGVPLGFGLFWEVIVPFILDSTKPIGCKYLYLFAADKTDGQEEKDYRKLISYYKTNLKFSECDEWIKFVKPKYDNHCYGLVEKINELEANRERVWHEFSDV